MKTEKNEELIKKLLVKFKNLGEVYDYVIIDDMLYLSCKVKTDSAYYSGKGYNRLDQVRISDYDSSDGFSCGFVIIDLGRFEIVKVFCFYPEYGVYEDEYKIISIHKGFLVLSYADTTCILIINSLDLIPFGGELYKVSEPYVISFPYADYFCSSECLILDTRTKKIVNLYKVLPMQHIIPLNWEGLGIDINSLYKSIYVINDKLYYVGEHLDCEYSISMDVVFAKSMEEKKTTDFNKNVYNIKEIDLGTSKKCLSLGIFSFDTIYCSDEEHVNKSSSYVAKLMYQVKYQNRKDKIEELAYLVSKEIKKYGKFDVIIPIPSSNPNNEYQPLNEVVKSLSSIVQIPYDLNYLLSYERKPIKAISDYMERMTELQDSLYIHDELKYAGKRILLIDDHIYKGDTIRTCIERCSLFCRDVFALVIARNPDVKNVVDLF